MSKIVWFELPASDTKRARTFYERLFGWKFEAFPGEIDYATVNEAGGAVYEAQDGEKGPIVYFGVDDIEGARAQVAKLGGTTQDTQEIPGVGVYAHCIDTEGNAFSLFQGAAS